ncbi:uncharacterized protein LOC129913933 [Episyrphus balteatus]|uniref:uncharacterized protein LOC129913933 n=1 Tax=Episyrphus balteatus TaxID=286459 RepID=UPI00248531FF|nr:uncharacterized protein LOC129913933 [Episyrphus balteatus]XP_055848904.1 uncharacterized protein LOC129913933 [Episyrphus balteatus]XP_055848905.1 uncharacterized protein LOC129913933 [Episyrphus balteatus]XP_055848906.1 uncharacterized protein LOC129913933 [Episyrphus balteatus]XP_055848907.1 uncharacterized protein LOC129913933 [Episyrphus balteatus]
MKSRTSGYSSDTEQNKQKDDLSVLRKPIHTALSGFLEAKKAYDNGTDEIRRLLARECDVIYECNTCRNIFRSLTNFISHKRVYCRNSNNHFNGSFNSNNQNGFIDQDVSTIIQAEQEFVNKKPNAASTSSKDNNNTNNANRDLSSIIERLLKREQNNRLMKLTDFYDQVNNKLTQDEILQQKHVLQLDRVPNSDVAVYQTVKVDESDNIKTEVDEVHDMHDKNTKTIVGSDGKAIPHSTPAVVKEIKKEPVDEVDFASSEVKEQQPAEVSNEISCEICKLQFATEKTLKLHIQTKHISSTFVFQCPSCSLTFLQPGAVIRHLSNDHKKSTRKIRLMREAIYKRRVRMDEVQTKGPSRELARLQTAKERRDAENKAWLDNIERVDNSPMCTYCGKTFERKAVLNTHLNNCQMKNKLNLVAEKNPSSAGNRESPVQLKNNKLTNLVAAEKPSATNRVVSPILITTAPTTNKLVVKQLADESKLINSNSNSVDSFDLEHKYDINGDSKDSIDLLEIKEELTGQQNRRKRRKPPKILTRNDDVDSDTLNELFANLGKNTDELSLKTVCLDNLTRAAENDELQKEVSHIVKVEDKPSEPAVVAVKAEPKQRVNPNTKQLPCFCKICHKRFDALSNLRRHISMFHYRSRKFGCKLCDYRAFRKYDVVNHLGSAHSIAGDKETTLEFVRIYEEKYFKDGVEEDIVLITDNGNVPKENKPEEKRQRRPRGSAKAIVASTSRQAASAAPEAATSEPKITRSSSQLSLSSTDDSIPNKRPIRNRVKPVNKDFVYDLSNLLKKDMLFAERESMKSLKRRSTNSVATDDSNQEAPSPSTTPSSPVISDTNKNEQVTFGFVLTKDLVQGAAQKMAQNLVSQGRAALATLPEIPTQRPLMRSRLISVFRSCGSVPIIETSDLEEAQYRASLSEDSFIDNFSKRRKIDLNLKPRLSLPDSPLNSLLMKVDMRKKSQTKNIPQNDSGYFGEEDNNKKSDLLAACPTEKEFQEFAAKQLIEPVKKVHVLPFVDPVPSIPNFSSPPPTPTKRITLFQRLNENKAKRLQESLLRSALEN